MRRYTKLRGAAKGGAEKAGASKGPWTKEEDRRVMELVAKHGPKRWSQIASELPGEWLFSLSTYVNSNDLYVPCLMLTSPVLLFSLLNIQHRTDWQTVQRTMAQPSES